MKTTDDLNRLKYQSFRRLFPAGVVIIIIVLLTELSQNTLSTYDAIMLPLFALLVAGCTIALWRNKSNLRIVEFVIISIIVIYFLGQFYTIVIDRYFGFGKHSFNTFPQWIPAFYLVIFFIYPPKKALFGSALFYSGLLIPGALFIRLGMSVQDRFSLIHIFLSNAIYIALIFFIMRLKEHYIQANASSEMMEKLATTDFLTGINNRRHLVTLLESYFALATRYDRPFSVILFDLDYFKNINDVEGHHAGDEVLRSVSELVQKNIRMTDHLGRWGGDEFLILAPETDLQNTVALAEKIRITVAGKRRYNDSNITISIGVATCSSSDTPESLVKRADTGLLQAKQNGKNRVEVG